ncbi:hypothetical protein POM88_002554 [Heracleum sosnowskyi]|uniref:Uncharacterized protein n=1 Tax=Heracleum sosnowskyi TaxID=360622 RepID=A0AAD8NAL1_9APIA|nr:hypothetical protein POM88_002554 [Heracleum sosnowskyi]
MGIITLGILQDFLAGTFYALQLVQKCIFSTLQRENHQAAPVSLTPTKELVDSQEEKRVEVENLVENSVVDADRVRHVGAPVAGTGIDQGSSSRGNSDILLWQDLEISSEFVGLLDLIMERYPATFECLVAKGDMFYTMELNMLCTSVSEFLRTSITEFSTDIITEYRDLFDDLQERGFRVHWLVNHLNYIEQVQFSQNGLHAIDSCTGDAKTKDVQSYCLEKIQKI